MSTADEILSDPREALGLSPSDIITNVIIVVEYAELDEDAYQPERPRLAQVTDDAMTPWRSLGMLEFAQQTEMQSVMAIPDDGEDDE